MPSKDDAKRALSPTQIDEQTFDQILEMDEPGDTEFSQSIVFGFFDQAEQTFNDIDDALQSKDLAKLSSLGHFLKGSSATIGLYKVKDGCEKIQNYGQRKDDHGEPIPDSTSDEEPLKKIKDVVNEVKSDYMEAQGMLRDYYEGLDGDS